VKQTKCYVSPLIFQKPQIFPKHPDFPNFMAKYGKQLSGTHHTPLKTVSQVSVSEQEHPSRALIPLVAKGHFGHHELGVSHPKNRMNETPPF